MNEDPEYLTKYRIHIYDGNGQRDHADRDRLVDRGSGAVHVPPGAGRRELDGPRARSTSTTRTTCYLHDTPQKALFGENARFHSSGCVRVENVDQLVAWLLRDNGGWDIRHGRRGLRVATSGSTSTCQGPVPIHTTYITAWANRQGTVSFRDDVYQFDAEGKVTFEG